MIGGARIIGGDPKAYKRGYIRALRKCLETKGNLEQLQEILREAMKSVLRVLDVSEPESTEIGAYESAVMDVLQEYYELRSIAPDHIAWKIVQKRIYEVILNGKIREG